MSAGVNYLGRLLRRAHLIAARRYRLHLAPLGLSPGEARLLQAVVEAPGVSLSLLAASADLDLPSVSAKVERLLAGGTLRREADPRDRRRLLLYPTAAGEALEPRIRAARQATEAELAELLRPATTDELKALLLRLVEAGAARDVALPARGNGDA